MFAKRTLLVVPLILVFCLIGCSNPSGSDDTTYSIDAYKISASCYQYLIDKKPESAEDILAYVESHEGELYDQYSGDTIEDFEKRLEEIGLEDEFISECVGDLQRYGGSAILYWYNTKDPTYWMLYVAKE